MLIDELKAIQAEHHYLPEEELRALSERSRVPLYQIQGVASFFPHFRLTPPPELEIQVCADISCHLRGAPALRAALTKRFVAEGSAQDGQRLAPCPVPVVVGECSCLGQCDRAPAVSANHMILAGTDEDRLIESLEQIRAGNPLPYRRRTSMPLDCDPYFGEVRSAESGVQGDFESSLAAHRALRTAHWRSAAATYDVFRRYEKQPDPTALLAELKASGLRGLGGAGFPTAAKWEIVRGAPGAPKYVVCNADESEPGTFKDRAILEQAPHLVLEGMMLAARVVGAEEGIVYIRHEYARERAILERERDRCVAEGLLDPGPGGSRGLWVRVFESPGGYICGEETALLEALEGKRAEPRNKPPFPGTHGLHGRPTVINNVETLALAPVILARGADWFRAQGREGAPGVKILALSGDVRRPGVYEVPFGLPARELIQDYGRGPKEGRALKAFSPGGASSGFLPASQLDVPLEFGALTRAGSMLGSGAVVAICEPACMLDLALNLVRFFRNESCGKCVPCRTGSQHLVRILEGFRRGEGSADDVALIEELNETMKATSICGLGQVAAAPIVSALRYWGDEILAHVTERRCPTGVCPIGRK
jgi:formate dehydrogenase/NADH-quinone oxidoreductase subunit F